MEEGGERERAGYVCKTHVFTYYLHPTQVADFSLGFTVPDIHFYSILFWLTELFRSLTVNCHSFATSVEITVRSSVRIKMKIPVKL